MLVREPTVSSVSCGSCVIGQGGGSEEGMSSVAIMFPGWNSLYNLSLLPAPIPKEARRNHPLKDTTLQTDSAPQRWDEYLSYQQQQQQQWRQEYQTT